MGLGAVALESVQAGRRDPRRLDPHPAARQEPVPHARPDARPQGAGSAARALARAQLHQGRDPRALSEPRVLRQQRDRHRGRVADLFRQVGAQSVARRGGDPRRLDAGALAPQPQGRSGAGRGPPAASCCRPWPTRAISPTPKPKAADDRSQRRQIRTKVAGAESYVADWVEGLVAVLCRRRQGRHRRLHDDQLGPAEGGRIPDQGSGRRAGPEVQLHPGRAGRRSMPMARCAPWSAAPTTSRASTTAPSPRGASRARPSSPSSTWRRWKRAIRPTPSPTTPRSTSMAGSPTTPTASIMGQITLRQALAYSRNTVAAQLAVECRPRQGRRGRPSAWAFPRRCRPCPRSRSARRKSRCSS